MLGATLGPLQAPARPRATTASAGRSLYGLAANWTSDDGRTLRLQELSGRAQILALIFTRCASVCPTLVKDLQRLEAALPEPQRQGAQFTLVTIDPEHDTLEVLRAYRKRLGLDAAHWQLLRGSDAQVRELSAALGFSYSNEAGQLPLHSRLVTVLDRHGGIVHQQQGVQDDEQRLLRAVRDAT